MTVIRFLLLGLLFNINQTLIAQDPLILSNYSTHTIYSDTLGEERTYWISLPASYSDKHKDYKRYPVLILLDGHIHFEAINGILNFMSGVRNRERQVPEMIVIGMMNVNRERDFTPDKIITKRINSTGGGNRFLAFLEKELIPKIDNQYRSMPYRLLFGHSLGGLITAHAYLQPNSIFNAFIAVDPSFGTCLLYTSPSPRDS